MDIGASWGDTLEAIKKFSDNTFKKVYCLEPDSTSFIKLKQNAKPYGDRVILLNEGAWDKTERLNFIEDADHGASKVIEGCIRSPKFVLVDKIDNIVNKNDNIVHIKMDIEGAEYNAIVGASETIKRNKPILAICIYHRNEDLIEIPKLIKEIVPEYRFYLRHHNISGTETVVYALI